MIEREVASMSWAELEWPDLSPAFPEPVVATPAPAKPNVPADIAERVRTAERRRAVGVKLCVLAGTILCAVSFALYAVAARNSSGSASGAERAPVLALALLAAGLIVAFPVAALAALKLGPTWEQRQRHWAYEHWRRDHARWLALQRRVYLDALSTEQRATFTQRLREREGA